MVVHGLFRPESIQFGKFHTNLLHLNQVILYEVIQKLSPAIFYPLNEVPGDPYALAGTTPNIMDVTGNTDGIVNGATLNQPISPDLFGYDFDGNNDVIAIPNDPLLANLTNQTWCALIDSDTTNSSEWVLAWGNNTATDHVPLSYSTNNRFFTSFRTSGGTASTFSENNDAMVGKPHIVFITFGTDDFIARQYLGVNGTVTLLGTTTQNVGSGTVLIPTSDFNLGNRTTLAAPYDGRIGLVAGWDNKISTDVMLEITIASRL